MAAMMPQQAPQKQKCTFSFDETTEGVLTAKDLSAYLYYLRILYAILLDQLEDVSISDLVEEQESLIENITSFVNSNLSNDFLAHYYSADIGEFELEIEKIKKESPLEIVLMGSLVALVAAAILSGGEVDLKFAKFKLQPIGVGLAKLKKVFGRR